MEGEEEPGEGEEGREPGQRAGGEGRVQYSRRGGMARLASPYTDRSRVSPGDLE